jgi:hypothetical protein
VQNIKSDVFERIVEMMMECWRHDPHARPKIDDVCETLDSEVLNLEGNRRCNLCVEDWFLF